MSSRTRKQIKREQLLDYGLQALTNQGSHGAGLAGDEDEDVRMRVAGNPNTPDEALILLASDKDADVHNPTRERLRDLPPERQSRLKELATPLLQECMKGSQPSLPRLITLLHSQCPVPALAQHFRSSDWRERCAIAQNPSTPPNTLALLASEVRAARPGEPEDTRRGMTPGELKGKSSEH